MSFVKVELTFVEWLFCWIELSLLSGRNWNVLCWVALLPWIIKVLKSHFAIKFDFMWKTVIIKLAFTKSSVSILHKFIILFVICNWKTISKKMWNFTLFTNRRQILKIVRTVLQNFQQFLHYQTYTFEKVKIWHLSWT